MKIAMNHRGKLLISVLVLFVIMTGTAQSVRSQAASKESPGKGAVLGNAFASSDFETVNVTNGNLMLNFPLGVLPAGRSSIRTGISLTYNSKLWDIGTEKILDYRIYPGEAIPRYFNKTVINANVDSGGWRLTNGNYYSLKIENRLDQYPQPRPECQLINNGGHTSYWEELTYIHKVKVMFPDGSAHEMIPYGVIDAKHDRYYDVDVNGYQENCGGSRTFVGRPTYYSVDGTYLFLETQSETDWTLYFPDGRKVVSGLEYDKNGNSAIDAFERSVRVGENLAGDTTVTSDGINGEDIVWTVKWKFIRVSKTYASCPDDHTCTEENLRSPLVASLRVVDKIIQPTQLGGGEYVFGYNAPNDSAPADPSYGWGEVNYIKLPSGAEIHYDYMLDDQDGPDWLGSNGSRSILKNYPYQKQLQYHQRNDGVTDTNWTTETWGYTVSSTGGSTTAPDGSVTTIEFGATEPYSPSAPVSWDSGLTYKSVAADGTKTENVWAENYPVPCTNSFSCYSSPVWLDTYNAYNPYVKTTFTSIKDASNSYTLTAIKDFTYDKNGNVTEVKEYDWVPYANTHNSSGVLTGIPSGITPKRITKTEFHRDTPAASSTVYNDPDTYYLVGGQRLLNLAKSAEVQDGSGNPKSRSEITYDYTTYGSNVKGGNSVEVKAWDNTKGAYNTSLTTSNSISTSTVYNAYGMPTQTTDAKGVQTTITYGAIAPNSSVSDLYPTKVETASNYSSLKRTAATTYDFYTGLPLTSTDVDNSLTNATEYDALGRPIKAIIAQTTPLESWTTTEYHDNDRFIVVRSDLEAKGDGKKVATQFFDEIGRVRLSKTLEDATTQSATNETDGIKVQTRYKYTTGQNGSYTLTSNPYRASNSSGASSEETMGWSVDYESTSGNLSTTEEFSGAALPAPWGSNSNSTGTSKEEESANTTTVTDEAGKKRRTINDALGRMIRVDEPNDSNEFGSISSPNQATEYLYDPLGNLTQIVQSGQTRSFSYSSLSRLLQSTNPESGTFQYTYDNNGNLSTKTDARSVITTYTYDALNRATFRNYSDATPDITYTYDDNQVPFSKGKLTKTSSSISESLITGYDEQERITGSSQVLDPKTYDFTYTYDLADNLVTQTYPSGKVVSFDYDKSGDLALVAGQDAEGQTTYANSFDYAAHDQVRQLRFGNGKWETTRFNGARQITQIGLGHSSDDTGLWKTNYEYGEWESGNLNTQKNNGSLARQTVTVPAIANVTGFTAVQTYTYDSLDRLKSAVEKVSGAEKWRQSFLHDRFGNRNFDTANTTLRSVESTVAKVNNPEILAASNRFKTDQDNDNQDDYVYDSSGNLTQDALGRQFSYDAENRQATATGSGLSVSYAYDGNGKRVKTYNAINDQTTIFVYDAEGDLAAEYTINVPQPQNPTISYTTEDALGSPRVITDSAGTVKARRDFLPYGEELYAGNGDRTTNQKFAPNGDTTRQKFTSYQRDAETGLDFAQARYYSAMQGRFTSPDEFTGGPDELFDFEEQASGNPTFYADLTMPQSLNKYQYTYNNPYKYTDEDGHCGLCVIIVPIAILLGADYVVAPTGRESREENARYRDTRGGNAMLNLIGARIGRGGVLRNTARVTLTAPAKTGGRGVVSRAVQASAGATLKANKAKGASYSAKVFNGAKKAHTNVQKELTVKTQSGVKTRIDVVGTRNAKPRLIEAKSSKTAPLTKNQKKAFPEIEQSGATVVGKGRPGYPPGMQIPPQKVKIIRGGP